MLPVFQHLFTGAGCFHAGAMLGLLCTSHGIFSKFGMQLWTCLFNTYGPLGATNFLLGLVPILFFYVFGAVQIIIEKSCPELLKPYRIQQNTAPPTWAMYRTALIVSAQNMLLVGPVIVAIITWLFYGGHDASTGVAPSFWVYVRDIAGCVLVVEAVFFYSHRLLHHPRFYANFHKMHHDFKAPFGIAAVYAHPLEHVVSNMISIAAGPVLLQSHPFVTCTWTVLALYNTMMSHSGYAVPGVGDAMFHDWHHETFTECFGVLGILDTLHGTSRKYTAAMALGPGTTIGVSRKNAS